MPLCDGYSEFGIEKIHIPALINISDSVCTEPSPIQVIETIYM